MNVSIRLIWLVSVNVILLSIVHGQMSNNHLEYKGAHIGKLNSYAHQVSGELYAIDERTILIKDFFYDGLASGQSFNINVYKQID